MLGKMLFVTNSSYHAHESESNDDIGDNDEWPKPRKTKPPWYRYFQILDRSVYVWNGWKKLPGKF